VFSQPPGFRPLSLDLYLPDTQARALCLYLHGGGWRTGTRYAGPGPARSWSPSFFERMAALGLAIASAEYRLSAEAVFPAQLDDVVAAAAFLAGSRARFGLPAGPMAAWGVSAGGHLAALLALTSPGTAPALDAVACWYAPTDLDALAGDCDESGGHGDRGAGARESQLIGAPLDERPDLVRQASPVSYARAGAPPFLFVHGTADTLVPPRQSQRLADALTAVGASATVELVEGGTHMFPQLGEEPLMHLAERTARFLAASGGP
jgi:acetyl esterase/lipase